MPGIDHLNLRVADLERSSEFYSRVLGMEIAFREPPAAIFLRCGSGLFTLVKAKGPAHTEGFHFGFHVRDVGELTNWEQWLNSHGVQIESRRDEADGSGIYFRDPAGYAVETCFER